MTSSIDVVISPVAIRNFENILNYTEKQWGTGQRDVYQSVLLSAFRRIVLVMDQLNTHTPASLYVAFSPAEARRIADRLEIHHPPKHGNWRNMAEIDLSVLARQCLDRRLGDRATMEREVAAWASARNAAGSGIDWRFTTADARIKLKRLYPAINA